MLETSRRTWPEDFLITDALSTRPRRALDPLDEIKAMHEMARQMTAQLDGLLDRFVELAVEFCDAGSAGVSLLERTPAGNTIFRWTALAGDFKPYVGGSTPREASPCGICLDRNETVLLSRPSRVFPYFRDVHPPIVEALILPLDAGDGQPIGTIWILSHDKARRFDAGTVEIMTRLAAFTALSLKLADMIADRDRLHRAALAELAERKLAQTHQAWLTEELNHRLKNSLSTVVSVAACTLPATTETMRYVDRVNSLARAHKLLADGRREGAPLRTLIAAELTPYRRTDAHVGLTGPEVRLTAKAVQMLGMALHELATNAAKYGALSTPAGRVRVTWRLRESRAGRRLRLRWAERGGPPVAVSCRRGFGSRLLEEALPYQLGGTVARDLRPDGLRCTIDLPFTEDIGTEDIGASPGP
ncbi:HWE histidine kinase domain-containing protein [Rhodospirillaceae bacterium SYSU D60014]|uniref:HWE histidine kinase domain-containing protein n=1 Tax=Virgifigura deserti TaxID=2268457 RepID=UPI0013C4B7FD